LSYDPNDPHPLQPQVPSNSIQIPPAAPYSANFFWLGYFDHPFSSGMMEAIYNKSGRPTRMAYGDRDRDYPHLRTTPSMS
jgi:hypothetical protein